MKLSLSIHLQHDVYVSVVLWRHFGRCYKLILDIWHLLVIIAYGCRAVLNNLRLKLLAGLSLSLVYFELHRMEAFFKLSHTHRQNSDLFFQPIVIWRKLKLNTFKSVDFFLFFSDCLFPVSSKLILHPIQLFFNFGQFLCRFLWECANFVFCCLDLDVILLV